MRSQLHADVSARLGMLCLALGAGLALTGSVHADTFCFEAEMANRVEPVFEIREDAECSGGRALVIRQGSGGGQARPGQNGTAHFAIDIPKTARYRAWLRTRWLDGCSNSTLLVPPNGARLTITDTVFKKWHWVCSPVFRLEKGVQTLFLQNREDGVGIDQILLTSEPIQPPKGHMKATMIPGVTGLVNAYDILESSVSGVCPGMAPKPSRRYDVGHRVRASGELPDFIPVSCILPDQEVELNLWLRNNSRRVMKGSVLFKGNTELKIKPDRRQSFKAAPNSLSRLTFVVTAGQALAIAEHQIRFHVRSDGVLRRERAALIRPLEWRIIGPFDNPGNAGLDRVNPPEQGVDLAATYKGKLGDVAWRVFPLGETYSPFAFVDLQRLYGRQVDWAVAYAQTIIETDADGDVILSVMGDDMVRIEIDGKVATTAGSSLPATMNRRVTKVHLTKGRHVVLAKTCQTRNYWEFYVSFRRAPGQHLTVEGVPLNAND
ncbi:MAG: hypothetical protein KAI66_17145 [Lentisphaeria bacterium]|nr:hypothetical protein [Lentisphaeria bacterium]